MKEIVSHTNETVKMLKSLKMKKYRDEHGKYLIEGDKAIFEALEHSVPIDCVVVSDHKSAVVPMARERGIPIIKVSYEIIEQIASTKSPPKDLACLVKQLAPIDPQGRFYVAVDDINDPKNLGSVIRTADAVGCDGIFISENSADVFGPQVQRAAMGSMFHVGIEIGNLQHMLRSFKRSGGHVVAGDVHGEEKLEGSYNKVCIVVGNEARGISDEVRELADERYRIRIYGKAESLNAGVAAGIMLYDVRKQLKEG
ncbi:MAG: TrmH family RNA methyltransferase [Christensenellaceae bacterium]|jgi:TrmH family RNA methyltransferase